MERAVPWAALTALVAPYYHQDKRGRPPFSAGSMLRIHFLQQWFALADPAMEEALSDVPLFREFAKLPTGVVRLPDAATILRFRHLLRTGGLAGRILTVFVDTLRGKHCCQMKCNTCGRAVKLIKQHLEADLHELRREMMQGQDN